MPVTAFTFGDPHPVTPQITQIVVPSNFNTGLQFGVASSVPAWGTFAMPPAQTAVPYNAEWDMPDSASPMTYTVISGALPPGLTLSTVSGNRGRISGTPTGIAGSFAFTLQATNSIGSANAPFTIALSSSSGGAGGAFTFVN